jgi:hypothetical protein
MIETHQGMGEAARSAPNTGSALVSQEVRSAGTLISNKQLELQTAGGNLVALVGSITGRWRSKEPLFT